MEKITKEQFFHNVSDLSSGIAKGMKEIANGNASSVGTVKNLADALHNDLTHLSDEYGKNDKGVEEIVNAFKGVACMADNVDNKDVYYCPEVHSAIAETILLLSEKVFMEYYD